MLASAVFVFATSMIYRIILNFKLLSNVPIITYLVNFKFDFMAAGVLLAYVSSERLRIFLPIASRACYPFIALFSITIFLMFSRNPLVANTLPYDTLNGFGMILTLFGSVYLVALGSLGGLASSGFANPLRRFLIRLGDYSYTIYLLHFSIMLLSWVLINKFMPIAFSNGLFYGVIQFVLVVLLMIPFVYVCYHFVELPGIALGEKLV